VTTTTKKKPNSYDYTKIDHQDKCKREPVVCPVCLEKDKKVRMGHKARHLVEPVEETLTHIKIKNMISHCHFALYKGTQTPAVSDARNVHCEVDRQWVPKEGNVKATYRIIS
jgi:hypothetical protein